MEAHSCNPSTQEVEAGSLLGVWGQPQYWCETPSQKEKNKKKQKMLVVITNLYAMAFLKCSFGISKVHFWNFSDLLLVSKEILI